MKYFSTFIESSLLCQHFFADVAIANCELNERERWNLWGIIGPNVIMSTLSNKRLSSHILLFDLQWTPWHTITNFIRKRVTLIWEKTCLAISSVSTLHTSKKNFRFLNGQPPNRINYCFFFFLFLSLYLQFLPFYYSFIHSWLSRSLNNSLD